MQNESIEGLILRIWNTGENDRTLWVLTAERGRISILAKGARSYKSRQRAVCQAMSYADFEYYRKGDCNILRDGALIRSFFGISYDMNAMNLAMYLCEVASDLTEEGEPAPDVLRLMLNALYAIEKQLYPRDLIKSAFEFRIAMMSGYAPTLSACGGCGSGEGEMFLDISNGALLCSECLKRNAAARPKHYDYDDIRQGNERLEPLSAAMLAALRYLEKAPLERLFAFSLHESDDLERFSHLSELYLLTHLDREFQTLQFYKTLLS